jgi:hypothetical protein
MLITQQIAMQTGHPKLEAPAIAGNQFSLLINPVVYICQIIHRATGLHVRSYILPQFAVDCFQELEDQVPTFLGVPNSSIASTIKVIVDRHSQRELESEDYFEEYDEGDCDYEDDDDD